MKKTQHINPNTLLIKQIGLYLFLIIQCFTLNLNAQQTRGLKPKANVTDEFTGTVRAVVIGISDYQDPKITDLSFAHKDAEAFAKFLIEDYDKKIDSTQIKILTNDGARAMDIHKALYWLIEESEPNDEAIIFFAGHGDVETATDLHLGFLLAHDSPFNNYMFGAIDLNHIKAIISTLSTRNVKTVLISDACHSGNLAGNVVGGTQRTAVSMSEQFANEIKIMSCQPDELSKEGHEWSGHGAFTYHLIRGLQGRSDANKDQVISLLEIENYLETVVPEETLPESQIPMTVGKKSAKIISLPIRKDSSISAIVPDFSFEEREAIAAVETKKALENEDIFGAGHIMPDQTYKFGNEKSEHWFKTALSKSLATIEQDTNLLKDQNKNPKLKKQRRDKILNLSSQLNEAPQFFLNNYNSNDLTCEEVSANPEYQELSKILKATANSIGEDHYLYAETKSKQLFIEAYVGKCSLEPKARGPKIKKIISQLKKALELTPNAAHIHLELALCYEIRKMDLNAEEHFEKANKLAPAWKRLQLELERFQSK